MLEIKGLHHIAIICSDIHLSMNFYTRILGMVVIRKTHRFVNGLNVFYKADLRFGDSFQIELFSFPSAPVRLTYPEARGLRHLAFSVDDLDTAFLFLTKMNVRVESMRVDSQTGRRFCFLFDPDNLPIELYEGMP